MGNVFALFVNVLAFESVMTLIACLRMNMPGPLIAQLLEASPNVLGSFVSRFTSFTCDHDMLSTLYRAYGKEFEPVEHIAAERDAFVRAIKKGDELFGKPQDAISPEEMAEHVYGKIHPDLFNKKRQQAPSTAH